jgi:glucokinase
VSVRPVGALELGGSHVSAARVGGKEIIAGSMLRRPLRAAAGRDELLATIGGAASAVDEPGLAAWGVATPGPFDYERGMVTIRGVGKLDALYGVDLRHELSRRLDVRDPSRIRFLNDADAFLLGEWLAGLAAGHDVAMGVTLGTGLGSAFLRDGRIVEEGSGVPAEGRLDLVPFRGGQVEDTISARGLSAGLQRAGAGADVARAASRARDGDAAAITTFAAFGTALGEFLDPWLAGFAPGCLVVGGSIARSWDLLGPSFLAASPAARSLAACGAARQLDAAALIGAARHALGKGA